MTNDLHIMYSYDVKHSTVQPGNETIFQVKDFALSSDAEKQPFVGGNLTEAYNYIYTV